MDRFERIVHPAAKVFNWGGMVATTGMMLLVIANILGRVLPGLAPIKATFEIVELLGAVLVSLFLAQAAVEERHVAIDILFSRLPKPAQSVVERITCPVSIIILALIAWRLMMKGHLMYNVQQTTPDIHIPLFPFYVMASLGVALMTLVVVTHFTRLLRKEGGKK